LEAVSSNWSTRLNTALNAWFFMGNVLMAKMTLPVKKKDAGILSWDEL